MANTFRVITKDVAPASAGTPETLYTCPGRYDCYRTWSNTN